MDPVDRPITPQDVSRIVKTPMFTVLSLSFIIIYKEQYQTFWTMPEMCDRKGPYLMEGPIKKVSVWGRIKKKKKDSWK